MTKKRLHRIQIRIDEKDPDIYTIPDCEYLTAFRRIRKREPYKRFVLKIKRNVMWYINAVEIKL